MNDNRFVNENMIWPTLFVCLGSLAGLIIGWVFLRLPGALLGAALGPMVVFRALNIRPQLPRSRYVAAEDHPTNPARLRPEDHAYTNAPIRRHD